MASLEMAFCMAYNVFSFLYVRLVCILGLGMFILRIKLLICQIFDVLWG